MFPQLHFAARFRRCVFVSVGLVIASVASLPAVVFPQGENVRLIRSEMLLFKGKNHAGGAKGQEFTVLKHEARGGAVYVAWYQEDGSVLAVTLPAEALEVTPAEAWSDLLRGVSAFRDGRVDEARRLLARVARDPQHGALASALNTRIGGATNASTAATSGTAASRQALATTVQALREAAVQLTKLGYLTLALWLDEGADRLSAAPATKLDRADLLPRATTAQRALHLGRQAVAAHRLAEAARLLQEGLVAEPGRSDLAALQKHIAKDLAYAEESYEAANRMRRFEKGAIHALTAIERGLKACADHPQLRELKKEMQGAFEERTSPPVTAAFLSAVRGENARVALTDGHKLYTTRCAECHDLELLDSRGMEGWQRTVGGMARRAGLSAAEQARILDYLTAATRYVEATGER